MGQARIEGAGFPEFATLLPVIGGFKAYAIGVWKASATV
jgi:hypothetical protein